MEFSCAIMPVVLKSRMKKSKKQSYNNLMLHIHHKQRPMCINKFLCLQIPKEQQSTARIIASFYHVSNEKYESILRDKL